MIATLCVEVALRPEWRNVARTSQAVALLVQGVYGDEDLRDALAMVSGELLENAFKYAEPRTRVRLSINEEATNIVVAVTNSITQEDHVEKLRERITWLHAHESSTAAYTAALEHATESAGKRGGLGILRIAYEGGCGIDYDTSSPGSITVRASMARA